MEISIIIFLKLKTSIMEWIKFQFTQNPKRTWIGISIVLVVLFRIFFPEQYMIADSVLEELFAINIPKILATLFGGSLILFLSRFTKSEVVELENLKEGIDHGDIVTLEQSEYQKLLSKANQRSDNV